MKFYTSYFYQIRFFKPNMIPLSTAKWDPAWFHDFKGNKHQFIDKNGVINGLRAEPFILPEEYWEKMVEMGSECSKNCGQHAPDCLFMKLYGQYLDSLDFQDIINRCNNVAAKVKNKLEFEEDPIIIFIVHEKATCDCAERPVIQNWFRKNGYEIEEWEKEKDEKR